MFIRLLALALFITSTHAWAETTKSISAGAFYTSGTYGSSTSTNIMYVPVSGKIQIDDLFIKLTVPYISISSTGDVVAGMGRVKNSGTTKTTTQSGLGDVVASAGYTVFDNNDLMLDLVGNIKFGTADANKNLGTGENDYSAQIDGYYTLNKTTIFATAGYKVVGAPVGVTVNNIAYGTIGASQKISDKTSAGAMLDVAQSSNTFSPGTSEVSVFVSQKINKTVKVQVSVLKGLSDSSPNYGAGGLITGTF